MAKRFYYIASLFFVFVLPASVEGYIVWDRIDMLNLLTFVCGITILGSIWDVWATRHGKKDPIWLWQFHFSNTLGIKLFDLPIEEFLFYVVSSVYAILTWETIKLASETKNPLIYLVFCSSALWTLLAILVPGTRNGR